MKKKAFTCFLTYPNGGKSHVRRKFDKKLIEVEMINLLSEREVLNELAETFTLTHGDKVIVSCPAREVTEELIRSIAYPQRGGPLRYPEHVNAKISTEGRAVLEKLGNGEASVGIRALIDLYLLKQI